MNIRFSIAAACALAIPAAAATDQQPGDAPAAQAPVVAAPLKSPLAAAGPLRIPVGTQVTFEIVSPLGSKLSKTGDTFDIRLYEPLRIDGVEVLPKGTPGKGEVIHAARARAAGKAGELILAARYLDSNGQQIKLRTFKMAAQKQAGDSNTTEAFVAGLVATPLPLFVVGGEINIPAGAIANAKIAAEIEAPTASTTQPN